MDGWNTSFLLTWPIFRCYVNFREGITNCPVFFRNDYLLGWPSKDLVKLAIVTSTNRRARAPKLGSGFWFREMGPLSYFKEIDRLVKYYKNHLASYNGINVIPTKKLASICFHPLQIPEKNRWTNGFQVSSCSSNHPWIRFVGFIRPQKLSPFVAGWLNQPLVRWFFK